MRLQVGKHCKVQDPFAEVYMEPVVVAGREVPRQAVMLKSPELEEPQFVAAHSLDYELISNEQAWEMGRNVLQEAGVEFTEERVFWNGKKFLGLMSCNDLHIRDPKEGGITLGAEILNSYDGSLRFGIRFLAYRLVCSNGLYVSRILGSHLFKHIGNGIREAAQSIGVAAEKFYSLENRFGSLHEEDIGLEDVLRWHRQLLEKSWTDSQTGRVLAQLDQRHNTKWDLLNAFTYVTEHEIGGVNGARLSEEVCSLALAE